MGRPNTMTEIRPGNKAKGIKPTYRTLYRGIFKRYRAWSKADALKLFQAEIAADKMLEGWAGVKAQLTEQGQGELCRIVESLATDAPVLLDCAKWEATHVVGFQGASTPLAGWIAGKDWLKYPRVDFELRSKRRPRRSSQRKKALLWAEPLDVAGGSYQ